MLTNMFKHFPEAAIKAKAETFETLVSQPNVKIERIISTGQSSPPDFWYCQPQSEWVMVLQGSAGLSFENRPEVLVLNVGDLFQISRSAIKKGGSFDRFDTAIGINPIHGG